MRRINTWVLSVFCVLALWTGSLKSTYAISQSDPVQMLQGIADNMIAELKKNQATLKTKPAIVYSLANRYVVPYANVAEMARRVLPPKTWNSASAAEREQFKKEFTRTLIRTYAQALTSYKDQTVTFYPVRGGFQGKQTVQVRSQISSSYSNTISVTYQLVNQGGAWRLIDMSVEGVDMLASFRAQFADILATGSMPQLLARLSGHNQR